jgi:hypothetical protein
MPVDDRSRLNLHRRLAEVVGAEEADTLMAHLPPVTWHDVATTHDLALVHQDLALVRQDLALVRQEVGLLRTDMGLLRQEMTNDMGLLRQEMTNDMGLLRQELTNDMGLLRKEVKVDIDGLRKEVARLDLRLDQQADILEARLLSRMNEAFAQQMRWMVSLFVAMTTVLGAVLVVLG